MGGCGVLINVWSLQEDLHHSAGLYVTARWSQARTSKV